MESLTEVLLRQLQEALATAESLKTQTVEGPIGSDNPMRHIALSVTAIEEAILHLQVVRIQPSLIRTSVTDNATPQ